MRRKIILAEIILLLSSVFIFRGLWTLLDKIPFMHNDFILLFSFVVAVIIAVASFNYITGARD